MTLATQQGNRLIDISFSKELSRGNYVEYYKLAMTMGRTASMTTTLTKYIRRGPRCMRPAFMLHAFPSQASHRSRFTPGLSRAAVIVPPAIAAWTSRKITVIMAASSDTSPPLQVGSASSQLELPPAAALRLLRIRWSPSASPRLSFRYVQRSRLIWVLHKEANLPHQLGCKFQRIICKEVERGRGRKREGRWKVGSRDGSVYKGGGGQIRGPRG
ncbi:hypothetical protein Syun_021091 [Stephania yunnanensis]|uniref:Uncharacterized protein n=1 Tax=Stephania yunnanensis TaxID=152371 RepID=A0AAP0NQD0_9MAGN